MSRRTLLVASLLYSVAICGALTTPATAQSRRLTAPVVMPPTSIVAPDGALAVDHNPAALTSLSAYSFRYAHSYGRARTPLRERGDGAWFAAPLPFRLALGASAQYLRPTGSTGEGRRGRFSLAGGYAINSVLSAGAALRFFTVQGVGRSASVDASIRYAPDPRIGFAIVGHDLVGGFAQDGLTRPTFLFATAFRPFADDSLHLELAAGIDTGGRFGARMMASADLPYVGRLMASAELDDLGGQTDVRLMLGMSVQLGGYGVGAGVIGGDGFGDAPGFYATASIDGEPRRGIPTPRTIDDLQIRGAGARGILGIVARLDRDLHHPRVAGVFLRVRSDLGLTYAQEIRYMIERLEEAGKPVVCHLEAASGSALYACGGATRVLMDPSGGTRLAGISMTSMLYGEMLENIGVRADFIKIGDFKSAAEQYTHRASSAPARAQREGLLDSLFGRMILDLASDADVSPDVMEERITGGPYLASEALEAELVDELLDEHEVEEALQQTIGPYPRAETGPHVRRHFGVADRIGVVVIDGMLIDGDNIDLPLIEIHQTGGRTAVRAIEAMAADDTIKAIVVRIDSPGGSALASDQIYRALVRARARKPVIASMGRVAASGGYYVAAPANEIWADPATITGSIGIFYGKVDFAPLAERVGISLETYRRGPHAGAESLYRPFTPGERALLADKVRQWYRQFIGRVAEGRGMSPTAVDAIARGRVFTGDVARTNGLVDRLGGFGAAIARARQLARLPNDAPMVAVPSRPSALLDYVLGGFGASGDHGTEARSLEDAPAPRVRHAVELALALARTDGDAPLALLPAMISE